MARKVIAQAFGVSVRTLKAYSDLPGFPTPVSWEGRVYFVGTAVAAGRRRMAERSMKLLYAENAENHRQSDDQVAFCPGRLPAPQQGQPFALEVRAPVVGYPDGAIPPRGPPRNAPPVSRPSPDRLHCGFAASGRAREGNGPRRCGGEPGRPSFGLQGPDVVPQLKKREVTDASGAHPLRNENARSGIARRPMDA